MTTSDRYSRYSVSAVRDSRMAAAEREAFSNVCRSCDRPIESPLREANRDSDGWPQCNQCEQCPRCHGRGRFANANPTLPAYKCIACNGTGKATR